MRVVCDVEADDLHNPQNIWVIVCKDIDTGEVYVFNPRNMGDFLVFRRSVSSWVGHNFLGFDVGVLNRLVLQADPISPLDCLDTLVVSRLLYYDIYGGHSLSSWGERFGIPKSSFSDFSKWSQELEDRCKIDVEITYKLFKYQEPYLLTPSLKESIEIEHFMCLVLEDVKENGFLFNYSKAKELHQSLTQRLNSLNNEMEESFPPKAVFVKEITPRATKYGTLNKSDFRFVDNGDLSAFAVGAPFSLIKWEPFNAGSPQQIVERLNEAGWKPTEKTDSGLSWKVNERNLETVPDDAPKATEKLVQRLLVANRVRTLEQWFQACTPSSEAPGAYRVHGTIHHIGAWTHRCAHSDPNMGNVPSLHSKYSSKELKAIAYEIGKEMRSLWCCPENKLLVGCDAEGIQLRIFAHYIDDPEFTRSLIAGNKEDGTDCHSLNARALGEGVSRDQAKTFIYAFLLGAGVERTAEIFGCSMGEAKERRENFISKYPGLKYLREEFIPRDVKRGYFDGFDGRKVMIAPDKRKGNVIGNVLGGYLQNGEACIMKHSNILWRRRLVSDSIWFKQVNFVHDEWQTEVNPEEAELVGKIQAQAITDVGVHFGLHCPMAGNYKIGRNWYETH